MSYIDMCHSSATKYRGLHVTLSGFDQDKNIMIVGWALVPTENRHFYKQAFNIWKKLVDESDKPKLDAWVKQKDHVAMSDRQKGIPAVLDEMMPDALNFNCTRHIIQNCKTAHPGKYEENDIWAIQSSKTEEAYKQQLEKLRTKCVPAWRYISNIKPASWCVWPHLKTRSLYGNRTNNTAESANSMTMPQRHMEPLYAMDEICMAQLSRYAKFTRSAIRREEQSELLTNYAQDMYNIEKQEAHCFKVLIPNKVCIVVNTMDRYDRYEVDLDKLTCNCGYPMQFQLPCRHLILVASERGELNDHEA